MFRRKGPLLIYAGLLLFRLACALSPSYIHPDEFFQAGEVTAAAVFGLKTRVPWEYDSAFPCRSILPA
ncbi:MAG: hypothetical protein BJ554DRAFT_4959 [Olpidium bornovanus]|uniref:Mannosyltransferase n=1 Tax=Olpidium bornovanus TaxID=278681 RepID=A0A8H7ZMD2_9FUNG|nr:MAG: hypothetical protein BJ554DRAFT_4959 [Olpidium bornovanus]